MYGITRGFSKYHAYALIYPSASVILVNLMRNFGADNRKCANTQAREVPPECVARKRFEFVRSKF